MMRVDGESAKREGRRQRDERRGDDHDIEQERGIEPAVSGWRERGPDGDREHGGGRREQHTPSSRTRRRTRTA